MKSRMRSGEDFDMSESSPDPLSVLDQIIADMIEARIGVNAQAESAKTNLAQLEDRVRELADSIDELESEVARNAPDSANLTSRIAENAETKALFEQQVAAQRKAVDMLEIALNKIDERIAQARSNLETLRGRGRNEP